MACEQSALTTVAIVPPVPRRCVGPARGSVQRLLSQPVRDESLVEAIAKAEYNRPRDGESTSGPLFSMKMKSKLRHLPAATATALVANVSFLALTGAELEEALVKGMKTTLEAERRRVKFMMEHVGEQICPEQLELAMDKRDKLQCAIDEDGDASKNCEQGSSGKRTWMKTLPKCDLPRPAHVPVGQPAVESSETDGAKRIKTSWETPEILAERAAWNEGIEDRLQVPQQVPPFFVSACGTPHLWNNIAKPLYWGKRVSELPCFQAAEGARVDVKRVVEFLKMRLDGTCQPVSNLLGEPETRENGWFRMPLKSFESRKDNWPDTSEGPFGGGWTDWQQAWHGCKFEALYSILFHKKLFASYDAERGDRFLGRAPGVYVHSDATHSKIGSYMRFVPLCRDGVFWASSWEVRVDRSDRVPCSHHDQWVQQERSVVLAALWVCGSLYDDMENGWEVVEHWDPKLEANPRDTRFAGLCSARRPTKGKVFRETAGSQ